MEWFRFYTETIHDRKIRRLPPAQRWLWVTVLTMASQSPRPGYLLLSDDERNVTETLHETQCNIAVTKDDLADLASVDITDVENGLDAFEKQKMIHFEHGVIVVTNYNKRQYISDSSTERVRKHREKTKRYRNVTVTPPDTDTDTDKRSGGGIGKLAQAFEQMFGRLTNGIQQQDLLDYMDKGMEVELLIHDMRTAARNNKPFSYALSIMKRHYESGIVTVAQAEQEESERQTAAGGVKYEFSASVGTRQSTGRTRKRSITGGIVGRVPPRDSS